MKKKKQKKPQIKEIFLQGTLRTNPKGFGFVIADNAEKFPEDTFIPKSLINGAVDGDKVEVKLMPPTEKGPEGAITSIVERTRSRLACVVFEKTASQILLYSALLGHSKLLKVPIPKSFCLQVGDRVIVKVLDWGNKDTEACCEIESVFGSIEDASLDTQATAEEFQIAQAFPKDVIKQAKSFGKKVSAGDLAQRLDCTKLETFTIDPSSAKDFDDALSLFQDEQKNYHLAVHIADVAHYVRSGTPLDIEAEKRSNSTYFPGTCLPMLPEELSNNLCSLKPKVIRLCISVFATINPNGDVIKTEIKRTFIKSAKRFSYEEAKEVLDGKKRSKHKNTLQKMVELCTLLKKKRNERGSIDFALPETVLDIDKQGNPTSYHIVEYDITHQMVEEFMLKANELVAQTLRERGFPLIFRIHEEPATQNQEDFFSLVRSLGFFLPDQPTVKDLQRVFEQAKQTSYAQQLSVAFIRSMKLAIYSPDNVGHFGLALENYCHFTSPIRRYPDLIIQRLLYQETPEDIDLYTIATNCSNKERISFKAEQSIKTLKKLRLLRTWFEKDPEKIYHCLVTKIKPYAIYFEVPGLAVEGSLHISEIGNDYFVHNPQKNCLQGKRTGVKFSIGDSIDVQLTHVDLILLETRWIRANQKHKKTKRFS